MRTILTLLVVFLLAGAAWADEQFDFRNARWGMSRDEVKKSEADKLVKDEAQGLGYITSINGDEALLMYVFVDDKLVRAKYVMLKKFSNNSDYYYQLHEPIKAILIEKYGKPKKESKMWKNNLYRKDPSQIGMAIGMGHYAEFINWENEKTKITAYIYGNNFDISTGVEYVSRAIGKLEDEAEKKKTMGKL